MVVKSNQAAGDDQLAGVLFQHGGESLTRVFHLVVGKVWEMEELPKDWMTGVVVPVFKKGDRLPSTISSFNFQRLLPLAENFVGFQLRNSGEFQLSLIRII